MKVQEIREIIKLIDESSINEFEYEQDGSKIKMTKNVQGEVVQVPVQPQPQAQPSPQPAPQPQQSQPTAETPATAGNAQSAEAVEDSNLHKIESPMVGTFYASPSPEAGVYVSGGDKVKEDSVVCIVEAMKLFNEIEAEVKGEIVEVLVENGQLVEYGQPLFLVKPE